MQIYEIPTPIIQVCSYIYILKKGKGFSFNIHLLLVSLEKQASGLCFLFVKFKTVSRLFVFKKEEDFEKCKYNYLIYANLKKCS